MERNLIVVIMAGGLGTRMGTGVPKVLNKINGVPMIVHILQKIKKLGKLVDIERVLIVVGKHKCEIMETIDENIMVDDLEYIEQLEPLGTGHAVLSCLGEFNRHPDANVMILSGDSPLFSIKSMLDLVQNLETVGRVATAKLEDCRGYGRVFVDENNSLDRIIEHNDCSEEELLENRVNSGFYVFPAKILSKYLPQIKNDNSKQEYYLTDIIQLIKKGETGSIIEIMECQNPDEIRGANTIEQLKEIEYLLNKKKLSSNNLAQL